MSALTGFLAAGALAFTPIEVDGLFIDGFAGGGGASTGIAWAIGRDPDIAVNHSETALAIHRANHPDTEHHCTDIRMPFLPTQTTRGRPVAGAWFSPDCKEFSKAKGGPVKDRSIRALCWEVVAWLKDTRPTCGYLENVEEFEYAAPLDDNGYPIKGQEGREFKRFVRAIRALGYRVQWRALKACDYGAPTSRKRLYMVMRCDGLPIVWPKPTHGDRNNPAVISGKLLPYRTAAECIDWSIPCPSIFERKRELADATKRRIAHGVMRYVVNAAKPFLVPVTHQGSVRVHDVEEPFRTITGAHRGEIALSDVALARVRNGDQVSAWQDVSSFVTYGQQGGLNRSAEKPFHAVTASPKDTNGVVGATLVKMGNGEREGQAPRALDPQKPLGTTTATGSQGAVATATMVEAGFIDRQFTRSTPDSAEAPLGASTTHNHSAAASVFLSSFYGSDKRGSGGDPAQPIRTVRTGGERGGGHHAVVAANMAQFNTNPNGTVNEGHDMRECVSTIATKGPHQGVVQTTLIEEGDLPPEMMERAVKVAAFLVKYYATDGENEAAQIQPVDRPLDTVTTLARFAVVTVTIDAKTYVIVDIGLRMLKPRELANAQGFPPTYKLDPIVRKYLRGKWVERPLTIAEQISAIGNSVCPPMARALVLANQPRRAEPQRLAA